MCFLIVFVASVATSTMAFAEATATAANTFIEDSYYSANNNLTVISDSNSSDSSLANPGLDNVTSTWGLAGIIATSLILGLMTLTTIVGKLNFLAITLFLLGFCHS